MDETLAFSVCMERVQASTEICELLVQSYCLFIDIRLDTAVHYKSFALDFVKTPSKKHPLFMDTRPQSTLHDVTLCHISLLQLLFNKCSYCLANAAC